MTNFLIQAEIGLILFEAALLFIALSNLRTMRRLGAYPAPPRWPRVSMLVPARNEQANIGACVRSLLAQQYPNFQVLVLDDHSGDDTWQILTRLAAEDARLQILQGKPLPFDWLGKHWACHQLAQAADGNLLLFTDADTRHHPLTLRESVAALLAEEADLLTALPREEVISWSERWIIPIIHWSIFSFVPLRLAYRLRLPVLSAAIGQFMLFQRRAYEHIGGHKQVRLHVVDDLALVRLIKACGRAWTLVDGSQRIRCRMYHNFQQVYAGISKNLFAAFEYKPLPFVLIWVWLGFVHWLPLLTLALFASGAPLPPLVPSLALLAMAMAFLLWGITLWRFGFPRYLVFLYPITILMAVVIAIRSMVLTLTGRVTWSGRTLIRPGMH